MKKTLNLLVFMIIIFATPLLELYDISAKEMEKEVQTFDDTTTEILGKGYDSSKANELTNKDISEYISMIEQELEENNTSIEEIFMDEIIQIQDDLDSRLSSENKNILNERLINLNEIVDDYSDYKQMTSIEEIFSKSRSIGIDPGILPDPLLQYRAAVASAIAIFQLKNWDLCAELLIHARSNNVLDSVYEPSDIDVTASYAWNEVITGNELYGVSKFEDNSSTYESDLYYSIHTFSYTKSESGNTVVLTDRYDYVFSTIYDDKMVQTGTNILACAQDAGVLTPYMIEIKVTTDNPTASATPTNITLSNTYTDRYHEEVFTLGANEKQSFNITFLQSGVRTLQTFGMKDTYIEIFDENGVKVDFDDDDGYGLNALTSHYFHANVEYKVRVRFFSSSMNGEIKLLILPSNTFSTYESIDNSTSSTLNYYGMLDLDESDMITYTPSTTSFKSIYTGNTSSFINENMYMYVIDPRHTKSITILMDMPHVFDDNSGDYLHSKVDKSLCEDVPYLIIIRTKWHQTSNVGYKLTID